MPKLIDDAPARSGPPIGEAGVLRFIDEMNLRRANIGMRQRFRPVKVNGVLTGIEHTLPSDWNSYARSPCYADGEREPANDRGHSANRVIEGTARVLKA